MLDPEAFVRDLATVSVPDIFNQYREVCPVHDSEQSPGIRRDNLVRWMRTQLQQPPRFMWVGEAGGYRGVRRTGLLLTSENWLDTASQRLGAQFRKATVTPEQRELSAGAVWRAIAELPEVPFIWAAIPLHAHQPGQSLTNRNPGRPEVAVFYPFLRTLLDAFRPQGVVAIGRIAERALGELGVKSTYVRHPSMAGIPGFRAGIRRVYGLREERG